MGLPEIPRNCEIYPGVDVVRMPEIIQLPKKPREEIPSERMARSDELFVQISRLPFVMDAVVAIARFINRRKASVKVTP